ncbi:Hypothetical predicted protein [Mytilus galloprovincialis]|uniref:Reverse transcriptase domain-containing protein n=1 Tax=Mytilus galloprovincialis TaxID=29158 RepID=A0A8B6EIB4_MYTGA|nr:Hypothetical predicted protein [Mytilus galloprovincialis]
MLRASKRKRVVPKGRGDSVAPAAKRSVLRRKVGDVHEIRSTGSPVATNTLDTEVMTMAPVPTTATEPITVPTTATEPITHSESKLLRHLWDKGWTPINILELNTYLGDYANRVDAQLLLEGFTFGFRIQYEGPRISTTAKKLVSAEIHKFETLAKLHDEVKLGRILGPFSKKPISTLRISPIGLVQKPDKGWRLISHLSYPSGGSINDFIPEDYCSVKYSSFDNVLNMIAALGERAKIGKIDIRQAFRLLIINPADFDLMGIKFQDKFYINKCLPLGLSSSCQLFERFSTFLHCVVQSKSGLDTLDHYLDDFIFAGHESNNNCELLMDTFMKVCKDLCVPLADNKTVGPTTTLTFLGLEIDTLLMLVRIPENKVIKLRSGILYMVGRKKIKLKELESIIGLMAFCSRAIPSSRAFTRRFYDVISNLQHGKSYYYVKINQELRSDALVWLEFLENFNGECFISESLWLSSDTLELFTDSSGNAALGCGAYFDKQWTQFRWPVEWRIKSSCPIYLF